MNRNTYLAHHGIKGQKWGVENGPPYPLSPSDLSARERKYTAKYKNFDGSLNEKGKDYRDKYVIKKQAANNKYYDKYTAKYQKKADKAEAKGDIDAVNKWKAKKESAEESRESVNQHIKDMSIDEIMRDVRATRAKNIKTAVGVAAGVGAVGLAGTGAALYATGKVAASNIIAAMGSVSYESIRAGALAIAASPVGKKIQEVAETGLRLYADARAYATHIVVSQTLRNLEDSGALDNFRDTISGVLSDTVNNAKGSLTSAVNNAPKVDARDVLRAQQLGMAYMKASGVVR